MRIGNRDVGRGARPYLIAEMSGNHNRSLERALTIGRNQASGGITFQHLKFTSLDGQSLTDGTLVTTANQFTDEAVPFDVDRLRLNISADVATIYGAIGITDRLDVAAALPLVSLRVDGVRAKVDRAAPLVGEHSAKIRREFGL